MWTAIVLLLALALTGCETSTFGRGVVVRNNTDVPVTFE